MKKKLKKGFTLVELVIVIAVIAILSAVLIPTFGNVISNANDSAAFSTASNALTQYTTSMASNHQSTDLPDGYIVVLKENKEFGSSLSALDEKDVAYTFKFEHGALVQYSNEANKTKWEYKNISNDIVALNSKYKSTLEDGKFVVDSSTGKATITPDTTNKTVTYWGAYVLDGSVKENGSSVTGKVILLGNVKTTAQTGGNG